MRASLIAGVALAGLAAIGLSGCDPAGVTAQDAQSLTASFCAVYLPAIAPVIGDFNAQIRADYRTAATACAAIGQGKAVDALTVGLAALALYEGVSATYPKLAALSDHDLRAARRLIDGHALARVR